MAGNAKPHPITIDLNQFKLHIELKNRIDLTLHFNSPSRRFYLSVIAFVVNEMKRQGKITSIPLERHLDILALLNETIGGSAGSSEEESLLSRIYKKWQHALPNLEEAPLFVVIGRKKGYEEGVGKTYALTETEKDIWANLFEYKGSHENVRLKFAIDRIGATLDVVAIIYEDSLDADAWEKFVSGLREKKEEPDQPVSEEPEVPVPPLGKRRTLLPGRYRWVALVAAIVVLLGTITWTVWKIYLKPHPDDVASIGKMAFPLPDVPSIAVMPFVNMSDDPKQEFLCDGMNEEIITALSKVRDLIVIARQSSSSYKGKPVKVKQVSEELGVRYVLNGGIQRSGDRVRINVQLIDALRGHHLWAERYELDLKDIFALEDELTMKILTVIQVKLTGGEQASTSAKYFKGKQGLDCYLKMLEGFKYYFALNIEDTQMARRITEEAITMCPDMPPLYVLMGWVYHNEFILGVGNPPQRSLEKAAEMAQKAIAMDESLPSAHSLLGICYMFKRDYDRAIAEGERAVGLAPGGLATNANYAMSLDYAGRSEEAIPIFQRAIRLNPFGSSVHYLLFGGALLAVGRFDEAVSVFKKAQQLAPNSIFPHVYLTVTYVEMGREKEARAEAAEVLRINPKFSPDEYVKGRFKDESRRDRIVTALRKAGLK